jgi:hemolysin activation/secretion protein
MSNDSTPGARRVRLVLRASPRLLAIALLSGNAYAQQLPGAQRDLEQLRQREERERLEQEILKQLEEQQQRAATPVPEVPTTKAPDLAGHAFPIERIVLQGERRPPRSRRAILARYEHRTLGAEDMFALVRDLTNDYAAQGFVTTTVALPPQNLRSGTLVLDVRWGRVKGWRFDGEAASGLREHALRAMLPRVDGDVLDIQAVDQAVEILNNGRQLAQVSIMPADETGWSWLNVSMQPKFPVGGNLGVDNSGTVDKVGEGRFRSTAGITLRGIGAETWSLGGTRRHFYDGFEDMQNGERVIEESSNIAVSMPFGFWDAEWRRGDSSYRKDIPSIFGNYASEGTSNDLSLKIGRTVARSKQGKTEMNLRVQRKENENFIAGQRIEVNSKVYTDVALGASRVDQLWGGSLYTDVNYTRGTKWLGANDVVINRFSGDTKALYYKYSGNVSWNRGFAAGSRRLDYSLRAGWQYTPRNLLSANKLTIGDEYTVRGFKGTPVYGDKGVYLSNTLAMTFFGGLSGFIGADVGGASDNGVLARNQVISGWAAGLRGNWRNASLSFTYAEPMQTVARVPDSVLYASGSLRF